MNPILYIICYAGLIAVYGLFAFTGRVPVDGFIQIVTAALAALGAAHIAGSPSKPTEPAAAPDAPLGAEGRAVIFLALVMLLALQLPTESCHTAVEPLVVTHQTAPIAGVPVLVDGAAVSIHCKF